MVRQRCSLLMRIDLTTYASLNRPSDLREACGEWPQCQAKRCGQILDIIIRAMVRLLCSLFLWIPILYRPKQNYRDDGPKALLPAPVGTYT